MLDDVISTNVPPFNKKHVTVALPAIVTYTLTPMGGVTPFDTRDCSVKYSVCLDLTLIYMVAAQHTHKLFEMISIYGCCSTHTHTILPSDTFMVAPLSTAQESLAELEALIR